MTVDEAIKVLHDILRDTRLDRPPIEYEAVSLAVSVLASRTEAEKTLINNIWRTPIRKFTITAGGA